ncbi:MAG: D-glycero-beta-D-manno-heptose 1,7-bisphosphate 7-phosphatase, partial [Pseudomonadales bacterium]
MVNNQLIILDRDGVINQDSPAYIKSPDECHPIEGSLAAIAKLYKAGYRIYIATNQAGVARGLLSVAALHAINDKLCHEVEEAGGRIEKVFYCPHDPDEGCGCRKPQPGLLFQIAEHAGVDISEQVFVGDSMRDIDAARAANCTPVLVLTGNGQQTLSELVEPVQVFEDLNDFATRWLEDKG